MKRKRSAAPAQHAGALFTENRIRSWFQIGTVRYSRREFRRVKTRGTSDKLKAQSGSLVIPNDRGT